MVLVVKNLPANAGDIGDVGSIPGEGHGNPLQYSCLENPMDGEAWQAIVHEVAKSWTRQKRWSTHGQLSLPEQYEGRRDSPESSQVFAGGHRRILL